MVGTRLKIGTVCVLAILALSGCFSDGVGTAQSSPTPTDKPPIRSGGPYAVGEGALRPELAADVRAEFLRSYLAYLEFAGDHDEIKPLSGTGSDFFAEGHPVGLARIESLGTLYVMELDAELADAIDYLAKVDFDIDADFQVFEAIIRVVGGLLSGHHATQDPRLLAQARDFTDRLMPAFEKSPTGMPYRYVNLHTGAVSGTVNVLAEIGTCITEFGYLSDVTHDPRYVNAAKKALKAVYDRRSVSDLVGTSINIETGQWTGTTVVSTVNPPVDSFFEYLFEGSYFLGDPDLKAWYDVLNGAILKRQAFRVPALSPLGPAVDNNLWFVSAEYTTGAPTSATQSVLAAFYAGLLAQSGHVAEGRAYHDAWKNALDRGGFRILPHGLNPVQYQATSRGNDLRPEYLDSALLLWLETGDEVFVDRAVEYYENMKATSRVENGYAVLTDVTTRPEAQGDATPAYWYAENMKYYYLLFGRPARFDYEDNYLTTEGNVLRGFIRA